MTTATPLTELTERPPGFIGSDLRPTGLQLEPQQLTEGVYALMANQIPKDNNGERASLVIDGGMTPRIGRHIQDIAGNLTSTPIRYLANTTFHGDHTFGNSAFADEVVIMTSRANRDAMTDLDTEKANRAENTHGDTALQEVTTWRLPELTFDRFA